MLVSRRRKEYLVHLQREKFRNGFMFIRLYYDFFNLFYTTITVHFFLEEISDVFNLTFNKVVFSFSRRKC